MGFGKMGARGGFGSMGNPLGRAGTSGPPSWLGTADVGIGTNGSQLVAYSAGVSVPVANLLSVSRAQTVTSYVTNADGTLTAFAANALRWGVGTGILIEGARTNLALQSGDQSNAAWSTFIQNSGTITRTGASGIAPDGTNSATLVTINRSLTNGAGEIFQTFTGTAAVYSSSFYVKANSNADIGKTITIGNYTGAAASNQTVILTGGWQRILKGTTLTASAACQIYIGYVNGDTAGTGSVSFLVWGGQAELGTGSSSYIPTTTVTVTRNADVITLAGDLLAAYQAASVTQFARAMNLSSAVAGTRIGASFNATGGGSPSFIASATTFNSYNGTSAGTAATVGNGVSFLNGPVNAVGSYTASGMTTVANGGTETTNALVMPAVTSGWLGSDGGTATFLNGYLNRLLVFKSQLSAPARLALSQTFNTTNVTLGGINASYLVPTEASNNKLVMYFHGAGEVETAWTADALKVGNREALLALGYTLSASNGAGENWGNQAGLNAYAAQYTDILTRYPAISKFYAFSQSMGGMAGLLTINAGTIPFRAWYGIFPVCNLANMYNNDTGTFAAEIDTAYNIPGGGTYAVQTAGHDPVLLSGSAFTLPMRFTASAGDTTVNKTANAVQMQTLVAATAVESFLLNTAGNHGDASNFIPSDQTAFYGRY